MRLIYPFCFALAFALRADAQLFSDDFTRGTDPGPLGAWIVEEGNWTVTGGALKGGTNALNDFAFAYVTNRWTNYSVQARVRFSSLNADGGGIGGRLNPFSGGHYAAWISPDGAGDPNTLEIVKFQYWLGYEYTNTTWQPLARVSLPSVGTNWHTVKLAFQANQISVYYDSNLMATATDSESNPFLAGGILASMSTANAAYSMFVDDVVVMPLPSTLAAFNDNYFVAQNGSVTVPGPGILANDSPGSVSNLTAIRLSNTSHGTLTFNSNGGFSYVPSNNFVGIDTFTYQATDGASTSGWATAALDVLPATNIFFDNFTRVAASNAFAPWVMVQGEWAINGGQMLGGGTINDYYSDSYIPGVYGDISVQTRFQLPSGGWACGVSARLNPLTGERYVVNIYPETSPYKPTPSARLIKFHSWGTWNYPPGTAMAQVLLSSVGTSFHTVKMACYGNTIDVYYDGNLIIHVIDNMVDGIPFYRSGAFGAHMYMYTPYQATFDDFNASQLPGINYPPTLPAQNDRITAPLATLIVTNTAYDPDVPTNALSYTLLNPPSGATIDTNGVITWTPSQAQDVTTNLITTVVTDSFPTATNTQHLSATNTFKVIVNSRPVLVLDSTAIAAEGCLPTNNAIDSGETVTMLFAFKNVGFGNTTNLVATLLPGNGVASPSGSQTYGALQVGGPAASQPFTFSASAVCGSTITATFQMQDGSSNLGTLGVPLPVGQNGIVFTQAFDSVTAPTLPAGWTTSATGVETNWVTQTAVNSSPPNAAFVPDVANIGASDLISPVIALPSGASQLTFANNYDLETNAANAAEGFDGGVLEIRIGTNAFTDILTAGGSFVTNGYTLPISTSWGNPVGGRMAWSGISGGFVSSVVNLPPSAGGQNVQLRWRVGTDNSNSRPGWRIDSVGIVGRTCCANNGPILGFQPNRTIAEGSTLVVTNTATDPTTPPSGLTYSLLTPPAGAVIDTNGIISWTPAEAQGPGTNTITTVVTDNAVPPLSATNSFIVTVNEVNSPPVLSVPANQTINELTTLNVTASATDPDIPANTLTFFLLSPPSGMIINPATGAISWTPTEAQGPSTNLISVVVTDNGSPPLSATNTFAVTVREVNTPPNLTVPPNQTINELTTLSVSASATDADIPTNTLTFSLLSPPAGMTINPATGAISWTPTEAQGPSTNPVSVVVTDNGSPPLSATNTFAVTVREVNTPPSLTVPPNQTINELTTLSVSASAIDSDIPTNTLTFSLLSPPAGMTINPATGAISWTPTEAQGPSTNVITVVVADNGSPAMSATNTFSAAVHEVNSAPVLPAQTNVTLIGVQTLLVTNTASDADIPANSLAYSLQQAPTNAAIDTNGAITWTPAVSQVPSTNIFTTVVTDFNPWASNSQHLSATNTFVVLVEPIHNGPALPNRQAVAVDELTTLRVTNTASDTDIPALTLTYALLDAPGGATIDTNGIITWTPTEAQGPSTNHVITTVTDSGSPPLSATNSFEVVVRELNQPPILPPQTNQTIAGMATILVTNTASDTDLPANALTYALVVAPTNAVIDTNGVISWTPVYSEVPSTNEFQTVVTDSNPLAVNEKSLSATNSFLVFVEAIRNPTVLPSQPDRNIVEPATLIVTNTAAENDIPVVPLTYQLISPPAGAAIDTNGIITWTPASAQAPSTNTIRTVVMDAPDGTGFNATNAFVVIVQPLPIGSPPVIRSIAISNGAAVITWTTVPGHTYRLQSKDYLEETNWTDIVPEIQATESTATATDPIATSSQRFYRVFVVN